MTAEQSIEPSELAEPGAGAAAGIVREDVRDAAGGTVAAEVAATIKLAVPLALTQLAQIAMFTTDLALVGRLGDTFLAAGSLAHTVLFVAFLIGMGVVSAVAPLTAQARGGGDERMVRRSLRVGLHASVLMGMPMIAACFWAEPALIALGQAPETASGARDYLLTLVWSLVPGWMFMAMRGYMSALDKPAPGLWIMAAAVPLNFVLAWLLIFGGFGIPALGLIGAGLATTLVNIAMCLAAAWVIARWSPFADYEPLDRLWRADWSQFARLFAIGLPIAGAFTLEHGLFTASNLMAGTISTAALASHQIAIQIASIAFMLPLGIGMAASVRVGHAVGRRSIGDARRSAFVAIGLGIAVTTTVMATTMATAHWMPAFFLGAETAANADTFALARVLTIYAAAFFIVDGIQTIGAGALRGFNDTRVPMLFAAASFWGVGFPACWALAFWADLGAQGLWVGLCLSLATYAALLVWRLEWLSRSRTPPDAATAGA